MSQNCVTAIHGYTAASDNQLTFSVGDRIFVVEPEEGGWALGRLKDGTEGWFPYDYVQPEVIQPQKIENKAPETPPTENNKKKGSRIKSMGGSKLLSSPKTSEPDLLKHSKENIETEQKKSSLSGSRIILKKDNKAAQMKSSSSVTEVDILKHQSTPIFEDEGVHHGSIILARSTTQKTLEKFCSQRPSKDDLISKNILPSKDKKSGRRNTQSERQKESQRESQILAPTTAPKKSGFFSKIVNAVRGTPTTQKQDVAQEVAGRGTPTTQKQDVAQDVAQEVTVCGLPLEELVQGRQIPIIVEECVRYLEKEGVQEGIFRLSGSKVEIDELKRKFRTPEDRPSVASVKDPHSVAVLLKQFFSQLPEPLFTFELFDEFNDVIESIYDHKKLNNVPVKEIQALLKRMPEANQNVTRYLMGFLRELSKHYAKTKMASSNLALVFGPNLLRSLVPTAQSYFGMNGSKLVEILILHYDSFFDS